MNIFHDALVNNMSLDELQRYADNLSDEQIRMVFNTVLIQIVDEMNSIDELHDSISDAESRAEDAENELEDVISERNEFEENAADAERKLSTLTDLLSDFFDHIDQIEPTENDRKLFSVTSTFSSGSIMDGHLNKIREEINY